jgi:GNAT superfamily N-acetyltransferase
MAAHENLSQLQFGVDPILHGAPIPESGTFANHRVSLTVGGREVSHAHLSRTKDDPSYATHVDWLSTAHEHRGKGYGHALVNRLKEVGVKPEYSKHEGRGVPRLVRKDQL